ncbi:TonB-dependent receptor plug domain-containing protein [Pseudomonas putida]
MNPRAPLLAGLTLGLFGQPISAAQPLLLNETSITDAYLEERADGPVQGYRANRSATATRTDTDLRDTPQSIDVVPAQVIKDLNTTRIDRALDFAGGVSRQNNFGGLTFLNYSVRGFTTGELYKNGFAINRGSYSAPDTSNIERIEVLKGPAASLYGRGDPGGLVNIVTKRPQAEAFSTLTLSAGSWDRYRTALDANSPLDSEGYLLGRINLAVEDNDSFRDHVGSERRIVSPSLSWQLSPDTRLMIDTEFSRTESVFDRGIPAVNGEMGSVKRSTFLGEPNDGEIRNDNQTLDVALEHVLNDNWTLRLANHYTQGTLKGNSSEPQALVGTTITRFYRERDFEWNDNITQAELHGQFELGGWQYDSNAWGGQIAQQYLNDNNLQPDVLCNLDALDAIYIMVAKGMGASVVPLWAGLKTDDVQATPVSDADRYMRQVVLLYKSNPRRPKAVEVLKEQLMNNCSFPSITHALR